MMIRHHLADFQVFSAVAKGAAGLTTIFCNLQAIVPARVPSAISICACVSSGITNRDADKLSVR